MLKNFISYLETNNIESYIKKASGIISELDGNEKYNTENILELFKLLANEKTNLSAERFNTAKNAVGISFLTIKMSENLYILSYSVGSQTSYILRNLNKEYGYKTSFEASIKEGNSYSSSSIQRGIGKNEYVNLTRSEHKYNYQLIKADKLESIW